PGGAGGDAGWWGSASPSLLDVGALGRGTPAGALGGSNRAAPADSDEAVAALRSVLCSPLVDERDPRVGADLVEHHRLDVGATKRFERDLEQPRGLDARVGDEQGTPHAEPARLAAELLDGARRWPRRGWLRVVRGVC